MLRWLRFLSRTIGALKQTSIVCLVFLSRNKMNEEAEFQDEIEMIETSTPEEHKFSHFQITI